MASPAKKARTGGYYKTIDGQKYDKGLLEEAEALHKDGLISIVDAKTLLRSALDGPGVTEVEAATLKYVMVTMNCSWQAKKFLKEMLTPAEGHTYTSYYKVIDGKKYDRSLLEEAAVFAADGQISFGEVNTLLEHAKD